MIYLDATAIVTLVTRRQNFAALRGYLSDHPAVVVTSTVGLIETVRACDSMVTIPNLMRWLLRDYGELLVTSDIRDRAANLPGNLRTLDAIHVATAEMLGDDLIALTTYDKGMAAVGRSRGLPVASPGLTV